MKRRPRVPPAPSQPPRFPGGRVLWWLAVAAFLVSMIAALGRSWTTYRGLPPVGVEYTTELNRLAQEQGFAAALPHVRAAAHIDFDNETAVTRLLESARQSGSRPNVGWALVALVRLKPNDGEIRNELVSWLLDEGRIIEAHAQAEFAVRLTPDSATSHCNLGAALLGLGEHRQAAAAYRRALALDPASGPARLALEFPLRGY